MAALVSFHRLAADEYRRARLWYAIRSRRAAYRFNSSVDKALERIAEQPECWPLYDDENRWVKLAKFPYVLIFRVRNPHVVVIIAVAHARRRKGYWRRRKI